MKIPIASAVVATVCYADIFDYPLTLPELGTWLAYTEKSGKLPLPRQIQTSSQGGETFVYLGGRKAIVATRLRRQRWAGRKWERARSLARWFSLLPSVRLVGVTGALAMDNTYEEDDIDFLIIVQEGTLWLSRLLLVGLAELLRVRRRPEDIDIRDKLCLNMFMSISRLKLSPQDQDLYMAHEVLQMVPLWSTKGTYDRFLLENIWARQYLPGAWKANRKRYGSAAAGSLFGIFFRNACSAILSVFDPACRALQLWYMQRRRTKEILTSTVLRFHPNDARVWIRKELQIRLLRFGMPLDKIFYAR